jgi:hypothetical protein
MLSRVSAALALLMASSCVAMAAAGDIEPPPEKCRVQPQQNEAQQPTEADPGQTGSTSLTAGLDECDGVLKPPAMGDHEMTQPPPATGETPIVRPEDLPEQQSNPR